MKKYIEKLRQKDDFEKRQIAFWGATVITGIIVMFWLMAVTFTIPEQNKKDQTANVRGPVHDLSQKINDFVSGSKN